MVDIIMDLKLCILCEYFSLNMIYYKYVHLFHMAEYMSVHLVILICNWAYQVIESTSDCISQIM